MDLSKELARSASSVFMESSTLSYPPRTRTRLIVRLGALLVSHSRLFSCLCCTGGILTLLLLPILAKNTYISENALMPGSANPIFSAEDSQVAERLIKTLTRQSSLQRSDVPSLIARHIASVGGDAYFHGFHPQRTRFHPVRFFSSSTGGGSNAQLKDNCTFGVNSVGIIRAPRGDGKESIVLITPYNSQKIELKDAVSLGLGFAIFSLLSKVTWLAKDVVWVALDSQFGEHAAVTAWLNEYHNPTSSEELEDFNHAECTGNHFASGIAGWGPEMEINGAFKRAGTMAAGLVIKIVDRKDVVDSITIYSEASNGQMPNLDLINIVHYLAVHRQAFQVKIGSMSALSRMALFNFLGRLFEWLSSLAMSVNDKWGFGIRASEYVEGAASLASSIFSQALGVPTGPHGAFRDYQVDAITLEISSRSPLYKDHGQSAILLRGGRLIEGVVRSVNNLLEKFHQSFFLYLLTSPNKFVSVGVYMIPFALLVAPLPIVAAALFSNDNLVDSRSNSREKGEIDTNSPVKIPDESWQWIHSAKVALAVHLWAVVASLIPCLFFEIQAITPTSSAFIWIILSFSILVLFKFSLGSPYSSSQPAEWHLLKVVMIACASIGLCLMSIINFATAQIGAFVLVPMCLLANPLKRLSMHPLSILNVVICIIGFPPATVVIYEGLSKGFENLNIGDLWLCASSLWSWNSATYLYMFLVHLPCWLLFTLVLLHP